MIREWVQSNRKSTFGDGEWPLIPAFPSAMLGDKLSIIWFDRETEKELRRQIFFLCEFEDADEWSGALLLEKGWNPPHFSTTVDPFRGNPRPSQTFEMGLRTSLSGS